MTLQVQSPLYQSNIMYSTMLEGLMAVHEAHVLQNTDETQCLQSMLKYYLLYSDKHCHIPGSKACKIGQEPAKNAQLAPEALKV